MNDELRAALDEYASVSATLGEEQADPFPVDTRNTLIEQTKARAAVEALFADAVKDAERYRFIRDQHDDAMEIYVMNCESQTDWRLLYLDNAVDAYINATAVSPEVTK